MRFQSIVIFPPKKDYDLGDLVKIARAEAQKKHGLKHEKIMVKEIVYVSSLGVYVCLYRSPEVGRGRLKAKS